MVLLTACAERPKVAPQLRQPDEYLDRTTGCIDTPFLAPSTNRAGAGVVCGREPRATVVLVRGRVVADSGGLPGAGLADLLVSVHAEAGGPSGLSPALSEVRTGAQGDFSMTIDEGGELYVVVRRSAGEPVLSIRPLRATPGVDRPLVVTVQLDGGN